MASPELDLAGLVSGFPALLFILDAEDRFLDFRAGEELYAPPEVFLGRRAGEVLPPPAGTRLVEAMARARRSGRQVSVEYSLPFPDGERHYEARIQPLGSGAVSALCIEVTARRRAEEALRLSEERFRVLIEKATDLVIVFDERGAITFASPSSADVLGFVPEELVGTSHLSHVHPDDVTRVANEFLALVKEPGASRRTEFRVRHRDGRWRHLQAEARNLLRVPAVSGVVTNSRDITEQRQLEQRLLHVQKLEGVGRLAGGVAHDFNNQLVAILGYAQLLEEGIRAGRPSLDDLAEIRDAGERARDLTRQLLAVARRQVVEPKVMDLNDVLRDAERLLRRVLGEDVALTVVPAADLWPVKADRTQIHQLLLNLAANARDAMPQGGTLTLETSNAMLEPGYAEAHPGVQPGPYALLVVSDSGVGMSPEASAHLFEPFFTTKPAGEGAGLGLATVYGIVKQAGGHVTVHSEPGRGTDVAIYLPRTEEVAAPPEPLPSPPDHRGSETVLLVEDAPAVRELAARALAEAGYRVLQARNAREALQAADAEKGPLHLLLTDVVMPEMGGQMLARALKQARPATRVLYVSGYAEDAIVHQGVLEPGVSFLGKPFTPTTLLEKVRQVLDAP
ncbi:MAG TPA: PAS domain-containing protein [Anaeromyxobacteraceae bacterium]|nr:PAS domain-containing protein [Anaeromyxobacteraceae bacterium]